MVIYEDLKGTDLVRAYSDRGVRIVNPDGIIYDEAIDPKNMNRTYEETEEIIVIAADEALSIISGENTYLNWNEETDGDLLMSSEEALSIILEGETE